MQVKRLKKHQCFHFFAGMPKGIEPVTNSIHIPGINILAQGKQLQQKIVVVGEGVFRRFRKQDKVEGISLADIEREVALDHHLRREFGEIDVADVVLVEITHPSEPVGDGNVKKARFQPDAMAFPWAHHQPVGAEQDLERVVIARPMMDIDFQGCVILGETDLGRSIQALGHIDGIADGDEGPVDLVGPHFEGGQQRLPVDGGK